MNLSNPGDQAVLQRLAAALEQRKQGDPSVSYSAALMAKGVDAILKKVGEEATEVILAAKGGEPLHLVREVADLWFHTLVLLAQQNLGPQDVLAELARREGISGLDEKSARLTATSKTDDESHEQ